MIPKKIFSIWLSENEKKPELVEKCLWSHQLMGYQHNLITLENCYRDRYIDECIGAKRWAKAADYLRMYYLFTEGGLYFDADLELTNPKPLDDLLDVPLLVCEEKNGCFSNAFVGSIPGHPLIGEYLRRVFQNFRGDGDLVFEPGLRAFADLIWISDRDKMGIKVLPAEYFFPYNHETGETNVTAATIGIHYFMKSWKV